MSALNAMHSVIHRVGDLEKLISIFPVARYVIHRVGDLEIRVPETLNHKHVIHRVGDLEKNGYFSALLTIKLSIQIPLCLWIRV